MLKLGKLMKIKKVQESAVKKENRLMVAAAVLPLFVGVFFGQDDPYKLNIMHFIVLTVLTAAYNIILFLRKAEWEHRKTVLQCSCMVFFAIGLIQGICLMRRTENISEHLRTGLGIALAVILLSAFLILLKTEKGVTENVITLVIFAGFLLRIFYVVLTQAEQFQNDATRFHLDCQGHLGYICHLFTNGKLPDIDPATAFEFCQPPLYYAVSAMFLKVFDFLRLLPENSFDWDETLQIMPLAYSMMTIVFIDKIGRQMNLSREGRMMAVCFVGFLPYSVIMSGALNNDTLVTLLMVMCIYYTFRWYEKPDMKGILIMALCIGCAMMTKLSGGLIAPAMAVLMLHRAWKDRENWTVYLKQFVCFGLISFPLGCWYSVYCYIRYRMPFGYVVSFDETEFQFIGMYDKWSRLFDFDRAFENLAIRADHIHDFADYNIPVSLVKFATFSDVRYYDASELTTVTGTGIFWTNAVLLLSMILLAVAWCFLRDGRLTQKIFMLTAAGVSLYSYVKFCFKYTHVCSMNIRYIMCAVYIGCLVTAAAVSEIQKRAAAKNVIGGKICKGIMVGLPIFYAVAVIVLEAGIELLLP